MIFKEKYDAWLETINAELERRVPPEDTPEKSVCEAMRYSLLAGGKRLRPVLALAVNELFGGVEREVLPFACAVEMIHTYSLIHDDLPAMDNDDYRRGRLTNHKVYGEARAILAGDALLNRAFEVMTEAALSEGQNVYTKVKAMDIIVTASGTSGMIGGQIVDLESEGRQIPVELLQYMHRCKTGALISAPILAAAAINNADPEEYDCLKTYSEKIGLAFQIKDDILDIEGDSSQMGKKTGSDEANHKSTYITLYGADKSKAMLKALIEEAVKCLERFGNKADFLKELALYIMKREN